MKFCFFFEELRTPVFYSEEKLLCSLIVLLFLDSQVLDSQLMKAAAFLSLVARSAAAVVVKLKVFEICSLLPTFMFERIFFDILPRFFLEPFPDALLLV